MTIALEVNTMKYKIAVIFLKLLNVTRTAIFAYANQVQMK